MKTPPLSRFAPMHQRSKPVMQERSAVQPIDDVPPRPANVPMTALNKLIYGDTDEPQTAPRESKPKVSMAPMPDPSDEIPISVDVIRRALPARFVSD